MRARQILFGLGVGVAATAVLVSLRRPGETSPAGPAPTGLPSGVLGAAEPEPVASDSASAAPPPASSPAVPTGPPRFAEEIDVSTFQKGNIHTHTTWSDGDHPPQDVYGWYRDHNYNFVAITDHNGLTDPATFRPLERKKRFVLISGEEITMVGAGKQVHVNGICTTRTIGGHHSDTQGEALAWAVKQVAAQGGVALVNHPNWDWALTERDIPAARGARLLEIFSGHPHVHTDGDETRKSHEALWDVMLTAGETFMGAAVDDAHAFGPRAPENAAKPGRAWIQVFAEETSQKAICAALGKGRLYSSSGVTLKRIAVKDASYTVWVKDADSEVEFIGHDGVVLSRRKIAADGSASYTLTGGEGYVRARITAPNGKRAWTPAVRLGA